MAFFATLGSSLPGKRAEAGVTDWAYLFIFPGILVIRAHRETGILPTGLRRACLAGLSGASLERWACRRSGVPAKR